MFIGPLILQIVLIAMNAVFASAEIAVISMNDAKMKRMALNGDKRAERLIYLTDQPARFLATIQVAITLAGLLGSAFAAENFAGELAQFLKNSGVDTSLSFLRSLCVFIITLILAYFNLVFGELVPKRVAMKNAEKLALGMSGMLKLVSKLFAPLVWLLSASTNGMLRLIGIDPEDEEEVISEEEIFMMLDQGSEKGTIDLEESTFIRNVFAFDDIPVEQACTHRVDVVMLEIEDDMETWDKIILENRFTYFPICGEDSDDILGVLDTKSYFRMKERSRELVMEEAVEKPYFVPETMKADVLLRNMRKNRRHFAMVLDEYGGLSGVITLRDLVQLLIGDMLNDAEEEEIKSIGEEEWRIMGSASLEDVSDALNIPLPIDEYETYGGFIFSELGKIPEDGSQFTIVTCGMEIHVKEVLNHRIGETVVRILPVTSEKED
ncbi:hemolysin family protein [Anaerotignum propionicum]|jgi:putative hemolysin|uniref:Hemolysin n=1 Tax=Anaerotignum propionicum DSM 1682 TaxID=991789 RepID=A0A0X8VBS1_ANAPI|nr:hemolysin family protein [Anaerotignum propionicum]AMJ40111.1 magnesium and cobalt efflux protein CorC [Anaerotignum propionicum DSM 1682]MEA5056266.1 hemolysin family protein [Anaerotignum propionicum]SHE80961.1 putative hemolysin [[Clostridium] propionicum DSM 1682] [Anaerotignum propionicum DSM 1682]